MSIKGNGTVKISFENSPSKVKSDFAHQCDINVIMSRYRQTGVVEHLNRHQGQYLDLPSGLDFQRMQDTTRRAAESFELLPAEVRERFGNNPAKFLDFAKDENNLDEMRKLGLAKQKTEELRKEEVKQNGQTSDDSPPQPAEE